MTEQIKASMVEKKNTAALHILLNFEQAFQAVVNEYGERKITAAMSNTNTSDRALFKRTFYQLHRQLNRLGAKNSITPTPQHFEIAMNLFKYIQQFISSYPSRVNPSRCLPFTRRRSFDRIFKRHVVNYLEDIKTMVHLCCNDNRMGSEKITTAEFNAILEYVMNHQVTLYREQVLQHKNLSRNFQNIETRISQNDLFGSLELVSATQSDRHATSHTYVLIN